jgi:hypothetical protein
MTGCSSLRHRRSITATPQSIQPLIHRRSRRAKVAGDQIGGVLRKPEPQHLVRKLPSLPAPRFVREPPAVGIPTPIRARWDRVARVQDDDADEAAADALAAQWLAIGVSGAK